MDVQEFILAHADVPYDPVKRREYYLKNRKLKGRQAGKGEDKPLGRTVGTNAIQAPSKPKSNLHETNAERVKALQDRLEHLRGVLRQLVKEAKGRSGASDTQSKTTTSSGKGGSSKDSKLTAQEKREAAKRSKEYREKHKDPKAEEIQKKIQDALAKIKELRQQIAASKQGSQKSAQTKPGSVGARNSTTTK